MSATDPLVLEIAAKRAEIAALDRRLEWAKVELATLERAAVLRPIRPDSARNGAGMDEQPARRGRIPGALSYQWRQILGVMVENGNQFVSPVTAAALAETIGVRIAPKAAADRLARYVRKGFTERVGDTYRVTAGAIMRFGLQAGVGKVRAPSPE